MSKYFLHCIAILFFSLSFLVLISSTEAGTLVTSDDFTGADGSSPDPIMWDIWNTSANDDVQLVSNTLRTTIISGGSAFAYSTFEFDSGNFTVLVDWMSTADSGRTGDVRVSMEPDISAPARWFDLFYGDYHGWSYQRRIGGSLEYMYSYQTDIVVDKWYQWNLTIRYDRANVTVKDKATGAIVFSRNDIVTDPIEGPVYLWIGVFGQPEHSTASFWDNYRVYNHEVTPNKPPVWDNIPILQAVEEVPFTYDFTANVSDPDGEVLDLNITTTSPYVTDIDGLSVTFIFPDGITEATVRLILSDGVDDVSIDVDFIIEPVYYPPEHNIPSNHSAVEDILYSFDMVAYIWDVDNATEDLSFQIDDPYVDVDGYIFSALFPEGVLDYEVVLSLIDGMFVEQVDLRFTIAPANDPPEHNIPSDHSAVEDILLTYDMGAYIWDIDTSTEDLSFQIDDPYVDIDGHSFSALFPEGVLEYEVELNLNDGMFTVPVNLRFTITPVNDPPVILPIGPYEVWEDRVTVFNITSNIRDVDTPLKDIVVTVASANCTVVGHELHFVYELGGVDETMILRVTDSEFKVEQNLIVSVKERNDPPIVHALPFQDFDHDTEGSIDLSPYVDDEETPLHELMVACSNRYVVSIENLTITFRFTDYIQNHTISFYVSDGSLITEGILQIHVESMDSPPVVDDGGEYTAPVVGILFFVSMAIVASIEVGKFWLISLLLPLYMKLSKREVLDQFTRGKILGYIMANPGEHYNSIKRTLGISNGSFVYHLNLLEREGHIKSQRDGIYKRYYPKDMRITEPENSLNKSQTLIIETIRDTPGISQKDIASFLGLSPSTVNYHVQSLIHMGLVRKERKGISLRLFAKS